MTNKSLWEDFELLFRTAYTDQDVKLTTYHEAKQPAHAG